MREERYYITQLEPGIIARNAAPSPDLEEWSVVWQLPVPNGFSFILQPGDYFGMHGRKLEEGVGGCIHDDGGVLTGETGDANDPDVNDVTLLATPMTVGDALYIGYRYRFGSTRIKYSTRGDGVGVVAWEYWDGATWAPLPQVVDGTDNFTKPAGTYDVSWLTPAGWVKTDVLGLTLFWVRARVSAVTTAGTAATTGDQIWINSDQEFSLTDLVKVELRRPDGELHTTVLHPVKYAQARDFQDINRLARLHINQPVALLENHRLVVMARPTDGVLDASASYFKLRCQRIRGTIF